MRRNKDVAMLCNSCVKNSSLAGNITIRMGYVDQRVLVKSKNRNGTDVRTDPTNGRILSLPQVLLFRGFPNPVRIAVDVILKTGLRRGRTGFDWEWKLFVLVPYCAGA